MFFRREVEIGASAETVFRWHEQPEALEKLTPSWEDLRILERRGEGVAKGVKVVFELNFGPWKTRWAALHTACEWGRSFTDEQVTGPFRKWVHKHTFEPLGPNRCRMIDEVEYELPFGFAGRLFGGWLAEHKLEQLFTYRHKITRGECEALASVAAPRNRGATMPEVVIIGAGLSGLCCALRLQEEGVGYRLYDASDQPGGRVRTDVVAGFRLDRGFQVFLTAYPEARARLDYEALRLRAFQPGAFVKTTDGFQRLSDPWRRPGDLLATLASRAGTLSDKLRLRALRGRLRRMRLEEVWQNPEITTLDVLRLEGFSPEFIDHFFRPFLGGIMMDRKLATSSRMFEFVFKMMTDGDVAVPESGMQAIPQQIAGRLEPDFLMMGRPAGKVRPGEVLFADGERVRSRALVVATDQSSWARLTGMGLNGAMQSVTCLYFRAPESPVGEPVLVLNGEGGLVNNLAVMTDVAPSYGRSGQALISATVLGVPSMRDQELEQAVRAELKGWYGEAVEQWSPLRVYRVPHALPDQTGGALSPPRRGVRLADGLYVCGDHVDNASINGAMESGRRAAEAIIEDFG